MGENFDSKIRVFAERTKKQNRINNIFQQHTDAVRIVYKMFKIYLRTLHNNNMFY